MNASDRPVEVDASASKGVLVGDHGTQQNFFVEQRAAAAAPIALAQLPPLVSGFTGRQVELAQVAGLLDPAASAGAVVVSAVAGLAGVGKTALAVHAAHAPQVSGWFPGGVVFIDLHGYDEKPVQPGQALDALLRALGVPDEHIPEGSEQRTGLYRSVLAQVSDPVLVIADNASSEAQVRPLLPGPGRHRVIVTSRHTLAGLGARLLDVTVLDRAAAVMLLDMLVRAARPEDDRISSDQAAAGRLAGTTGGLPLALQISAAGDQLGEHALTARIPVSRSLKHGRSRRRRPPANLATIRCGSGGLPIRKRPKAGKLLSLEFLDEWDVLIIYKLDRGFRNHLDFVTFYHEFCERYGKEIISVGEEGLDMSTPTGRMFAGILVQFAEWELQNRHPLREAPDCHRYSEPKCSTRYRSRWPSPD